MKMGTHKLITEQYTDALGRVDVFGNTYTPKLSILPGCPSEATTGCCSEIVPCCLSAFNAGGVDGSTTAITQYTDVRVWYDRRTKIDDPGCTGSRCWSPDEYVADFSCDYRNLCKLKNTLLKKYVNAQNMDATHGGAIRDMYDWIRDNIDKKICKSAVTTSTVITAGITGGCIDPDASNFCSECNADCGGVIGGTNTDCCQYTEKYVLKYTYRFCDNKVMCKGGEGTTLKAGEEYKLRFGSGKTIKTIIKKIKNKLGDLLINTNIVSPYNLVEYGFFSDDSIPESDLEDFATALTIILFGNGAIDVKLKYLDGGDILEESNTFKYSHVTVYSAGAGQLYLGNYNIISPNVKAIAGRIEKFKNVTTNSIIKNQLNWLAQNNKSITDNVPVKQVIDGEEVWAITDDMEKSISGIQKIIDKYFPGQYVINDDGSVLRESIGGLENLLIEEPIGLGKLLK